MSGRSIERVEMVNSLHLYVIPRELGISVGGNFTSETSTPETLSFPLARHLPKSRCFRPDAHQVDETRQVLQTPRRQMSFFKNIGIDGGLKCFQYERDPQDWMRGQIGRTHRALSQYTVNYQPMK